MRQHEGSKDLVALAMPELIACRVGNSLRPMEESLEDFQKIGEGELLKLKYSVPRDLPRHRKVMGLFRLTYQMQEYYATFNQFRYAVLIELGWCEIFILKNGEVCYQPQSMSFEKMEQSEFDKVYNDVLNHMIEKHIPGTDPRVFSSEVNKLLSFI